MLLWWGHAAHGEVKDEVVERVHRHVQIVSRGAHRQSRRRLRCGGRGDGHRTDFHNPETAEDWEITFAETDGIEGRGRPCDATGVIRFAHVNTDYKVRLEPEKILAAIKEVSAAK